MDDITRWETEITGAPSLTWRETMALIGALAIGPAGLLVSDWLR